MPTAYTLLTLAAVGALLALLLRPGAARPMTVWVLAALLPVLAAVSAALGAQARAARVLARTPVTATTVTVTAAGRTRTLTLSARDAACVARAVQLGARVTLDAPGGPVALGPGTRVTGPLPARAAVEALGVQGLTCPAVHARR